MNNDVSRINPNFEKEKQRYGRVLCDKSQFT